MTSTKRIALYGDSYISRLARYCRADLQVPGIVEFFGKGSMEVGEQDMFLLRRLLDFKPDVVFINIGGDDINSTTRPKEIAEKIIDLADELKTNGIETVYVAELCERGMFKKDPKLTKKSFNAQRRKINSILAKNFNVNFVKLRMKFPKDYDEDLVNFSEPRGLRKFFHAIRRVLLSHKSVRIYKQ